MNRRPNILLFQLLLMLAVSLSGHAHPETSDVHTAEENVTEKENAEPEDMKQHGLISDIKRAIASPRDSLTIYSWTVNPMGERTFVPFDSSKINYAQQLLVESRSVAVGYLGNLGSPAESKIFADRFERGDFIFYEPYRYYVRDPGSFHFINTKIPYSNLTYNNGGQRGKNAEEFRGAMAMNFGKKFNIGFDFNYLYGWGKYQSQSTKDINFILHSNYISDRYELNFLLYNVNFLNYENGGLSDDRFITNPDAMISEDGKKYNSENFPVRFTDTWNHVKGQRYYFTHRYNLGFYETAPGQEEATEPKKQFTPVASIFHTFDFHSNNRRFVSKDTLDNIYSVQKYLPLRDSSFVVDDYTSYWELSNTAGISLREGFKKWVKFGLSAYARFDYRRFKLPADGSANYPTTDTYNELATKIGGELAKREGSLLTYRANAEVGITGVDAGEVRISGEIGTKFPLWGKELSVKGKGHFLNLVPAFYDRHFHSRYFWWDNNLNKEKRVAFGGELDFPFTRTRIAAGVENISDYVYYNKEGISTQHNGNIQVFSAQLNQNFKIGVLNWENQLVYQTSSSNALPLPNFSAYSNLYLLFKLVKVLTLQPGVDVRYHTGYHAPYYDAPTQQFRIQDEVKIGNYPLINVYLNAHLKYTRIFVMAYNIGSLMFQTPYFSLAHYPLNPFYLRFGLSWNFYN